jgi:signal peptide peptidase SppA
MTRQHERFIQLLTRCPIWAILPESFTALLAQLSSRDPVLEEVRLMSLKPQTRGRAEHKHMMIPIQGVLTKDEPWAGTTYKSIGDAVEQAGSDPSVKRIVLDVDSPGGETTGLPETASIISQVARIKPVSAIVDGYAASAAYWLTSQANHITVAPSAEVGSVGVRMMHVDISKALEGAGFKVTELYSGNFKTEWSPYKPLSKDATADMQGKLAAVHNDFINAVAEGRRVAPNRPTNAIANARYGEGRMFTAGEAMGHGLADAVQSPREFYRAVLPASEVEDTKGKNVPQFPLRARLELERHRL